MSDESLDFLAELDAEISKITSKAKLETDRVKLQTKLRDKRLSHDSLQDVRVQLASINHQLDLIRWKPEAAVAFFVEQSCDYCGSVHTVFLQHMQREVTTSRPTVTRWVRAGRPSQDLPREVIKQTSTTHCCADCIEDFGFELDRAEIKFAKYSEPFSIPANYIQEEIEP